MLTSLCPYEVILFIFKQDVEGGHTAVDAGDILLQIHLFLIGQGVAAVDVLFEHAETVAHHHNLMEEGFDGHFLGFQLGVSG